MVRRKTDIAGAMTCSFRLERGSPLENVLAFVHYNYSPTDVAMRSQYTVTSDFSIFAIPKEGKTDVTPKEVLALCRQYDVQVVDLRYANLPGRWCHTTIPAERLTEEVFEDGISVEEIGFAATDMRSGTNRNMTILPRPETAFLDPFSKIETLNLICNAQDPASQEDRTDDPRNVAHMAKLFLKNTGIADTAAFGLEAAYYSVHGIAFDQNQREAYFRIDSESKNYDHDPLVTKRGHAPGGDSDRDRCLQPAMPSGTRSIDMRNHIMQDLLRCDVKVKSLQHQEGSVIQTKLGLESSDLVHLADQMMTCKYVVKNVARQHDQIATFMPLPIHGQSGSGLHVNFSLWKDEQPLFAGNEYAGLSETALFAIGGILRHAPALLAFTNPSTNSYRRLVPRYDAPIQLAYSQQGESTACRIPVYGAGPDSRRIEFRCPDSSCNPYLAFASILMAAIDGIQNKIHPGEPLDSNHEQHHREGLRQTPRTLESSLQALAEDQHFLLRGEVFSNELIETWIKWKRKHEVEAVQQRPHPYEFCMYYDV